MKIIKQKEVYEIGICELTLMKQDYEDYPIRIKVPASMTIEQAEQLIDCLKFAIETLQKDGKVKEGKS